MGAMASEITSLTIVYSTVIQAQIKEKLELRVIGLCAGNSPVTGEFPAQMASDAANVSIWWRHHEPQTKWIYFCFLQTIQQVNASSLDKMAAVSQTIFSDAFSFMKIFSFD